MNWFAQLHIVCVVACWWLPWHVSLYIILIIIFRVIEGIGCGIPHTELERVTNNLWWDFTTFQFLKWHLVTYELLLGSHYEYGMAVKVIFPFHPSNTPFDVVHSLHSCSNWSAHTNPLPVYLLLYKTHPVYRCFEAVLIFIFKYLF